MKNFFRQQNKLFNFIAGMQKDKQVSRLSQHFSYVSIFFIFSISVLKFQWCLKMLFFMVCCILSSLIYLYMKDVSEIL